MDETSAERWLPVTGYEGLYEVSDLGRVRSLPRLDNRGHRVLGGILKMPPDSNGYPEVNLRGCSQWVHHLVAAAFLGPRPAGTQVRHWDGNPANNQVTNLLYGTQGDNNLDAVRHGTHYQAAKTHCPQGHPYDSVNTYVLPSRPTARYCKTCRAEDSRRRRARKPRPGRSKPGEQNPSAKLTWALVREIRALVERGVPKKDIAEAYRVDRQTIWRIMTRKAWRE